MRYLCVSCTLDSSCHFALTPTLQSSTSQHEVSIPASCNSKYWFCMLHTALNQYNNYAHSYCDYSISLADKPLGCVARWCLRVCVCVHACFELCVPLHTYSGRRYSKRKYGKNATFSCGKFKLYVSNAIGFITYNRETHMIKSRNASAYSVRINVSAKCGSLTSLPLEMTRYRSHSPHMELRLNWA